MGNFPCWLPCDPPSPRVPLEAPRRGVPNVIGWVLGLGISFLDASGKNRLVPAGPVPFLLSGEAPGRLLAVPRPGWTSEAPPSRPEGTSGCRAVGGTLRGRRVPARGSPAIPGPLRGIARSRHLGLESSLAQKDFLQRGRVRLLSLQARPGPHWGTTSLGRRLDWALRANVPACETEVPGPPGWASARSAGAIPAEEGARSLRGRGPGCADGETEASELARACPEGSGPGIGGFPQPCPLLLPLVPGAGNPEGRAEAPGPAPAGEGFGGPPPAAARGPIALAEGHRGRGRLEGRGRPQCHPSGGCPAQSPRPSPHWPCVASRLFEEEEHGARSGVPVCWGGGGAEKCFQSAGVRA